MSKTVIIPECNKNIGGVKEEISSSPEKREGAIGLFRFLRLDTLSKRSNLESPTIVEPLITYYGVYIPCEIKKGPDEEALHVYKNKSEVLELVRRYKLARFKAFRSHQDAVSFALRGAEPTDIEGNDNSLVGEKPYPFKAPSPQDMVTLRKAIEAGLACTVRDRVWDNPRFLVSSGNTPAIMQEGSRYNALHIAAKASNAEICNLILTTVGDPTFVQTLYGMDADPESYKEFACILVDRYLNTPDKAMNETPLHFAAKYGAEDVVDVLTSFPQCNKSAVNKFGEQPKDIICKRSSSSSAEAAARIGGMLRERFYVPVFHTEDESAAPTIGRPFTPADPPEVNGDPLSPRYEIRAYAGPMGARDADCFRRRWKTPPRAARLASPVSRFRLQEITKGLEVVGRDLAEQLNVGWKEYWPFLDTFTDLRTPEGLTLLENYLKAKYQSACSFAYSDSCAPSDHSPGDASLSRVSLSVSQRSPNKESPHSPISELCVAMKTCKITSERPVHWKKTDPIKQRLFRQPSIKAMNGEPPSNLSHTFSPLLCIERTCQVFAKRMADALTFSLTAEPEVAGDSLKSEAKHLQSTVCNYMDDERFQSIDFALIHSRLAQLIVYKLRQQVIDMDDINGLLDFLTKLHCPNDDIFSSDDERKPCRGPSRYKMSQVIDGHVRCVASFICEVLTEEGKCQGPAVSETNCGELWCGVSKCRCDWNIDVFERNSKKNASFRKNRSTLSTSPKSESFMRRLTFDYDIGDGKLQHAETERLVSVNSPAGDSGAALYTVDTTKCHVLDSLQISDDESVASCDSDSEEYLTASEDLEEHVDMMAEATDRALAEPFIYGEEPTKMDRLVYEALSECRVCADQFPSVYRWRHTVALYSPAERDKWAPVPDESSLACLSFPNVCSTPSGVRACRARGSPAARSTPHKDARDQKDQSPCSLPLQVSTWLRVTGPNSPRSAQAVKHANHNVSFGF